MNLHVETIEEKQKVLIISEKKLEFISLLEEEIRKYGAEIFYSSQPPNVIAGYDYCFFINQKSAIFKTIKDRSCKIIDITYNRPSHPIQPKYLQNNMIKSIVINGTDIRQKHIDTIFWFSFSKSKERVLTLTVPYLVKPYKTNAFLKPQWNLRPYITKKNMLVVILLLFILIHTLFIPPLIGSIFFTYRSFKSYKSEIPANAKSEYDTASSFYNITKKLYSLARPIMLLFSIALPTDTLFDNNERALIILNQTMLATENAKHIQALLFNKNKNTEEKAYLKLRIAELQKEIQTIEDNAEILVQKIPLQFSQLNNIHKQLTETVETLQKMKQIFPFADEILNSKSEKKYLLLFANNMELRPGGGFLGSFGILTIKDYTVENIEVHDVYDADGQLIAHIDPPEPIRKYLKIPHGFLRDSNFSPDFPEDYEKAKMFLEKEINMTGFSGSFLITTTAIQNMLDAFGPIYIPDFNETITKQNFYLKTQLHTESNFFPGSIQKKSFLGSLARQILINVENASMKKFAVAIKKSLDEKQLIVYFDNPAIQTIIDPFYWSGRSIKPLCAFKSKEKSCIVDYLFPYDANVGANKVNFFVNRSMYLKTNVTAGGEIQHVFSVQFRNESPSDVFPGGTYKNYFQIMLPIDINVKNITKDGVLIEDYTETNKVFKTIGMYIEVPPKSNIEIKIQYSLNKFFVPGENLYQLIVQKQIGSSNNDYVLENYFPPSMHILNQNFAPLVKDDYFVYNTSLSADKIFFIELTKN